MKIAYTTKFNALDVHHWSGTPYYMSKALAKQGMHIEYVGSLQRKLPPFFKMQQFVKKYIGHQRLSPRFNTFIAQHYSYQVAERLKQSSADIVVSPLINPIAYLECKQPIVLWTDALYAALIGFYSPFSSHATTTVTQGNLITAECLKRCKLAIFSSDWAARSAIELYGANREKVKVIPFGANIDESPTPNEIQEIIKHRTDKKIKLLFLAKSWERKGGDIVLAVAQALHEAGYPVELTIVGYHPPNLSPIPEYIRCLGFISKHTPAGKNKIRSLLSETHFLFVPSRAEAYGIVFCEANAFAVPCLTTYIGGISTIVKDNINGMTFALDASVSSYCDYIVNLMQDRERYNELARSSYEAFQTRLNWQTATKEVKRLIEAI